MATIEQLQQALIAADKAGNAEDAKALAKAIRVMSDQQSPPIPEGARVHTESRGMSTPEEERAFQIEMEAKRRAEGMDGALAPMGQGVSFGSMDEVTAAATAPINAMRTGNTIGEEYAIGKGAMDETLAKEREERPIWSTVSEIAGALPLALAIPGSAAARARMLAGGGAGAVAGGGGLATRMLAGGAEGAVAGGIYGFAAGDGGVQNRLQNAGQTAAIGAGIGAAVPAVAAGAKGIYNRLATNSTARDIGMSRPTYDTITRASQADDALSGAGAARIAAAGDEAMLADAGPSMRALLDTATQRSGPAARVARTAINERVTRASAAINNSLDTAFGQPVGIRTTETALRTGTARSRSAAYDAAYAAPINYADETGQAIEQLVRNQVPRAAITKANALMRAEGLRSQQILARIGDDGTMTFERLPDVRQIDYITRALNDVAAQANGQGALGGTTQLGRTYGNLSRELRGLVREAVPEYATALETAAEPIAARNALKLGRTALTQRVARDELLEQMAGMTSAERSYVAQGVRSQIDEALANVRRTITDGDTAAREAMEGLKSLSSRAAREKVETVIGPQKASQLFDDLDRATTAFELKAATAENTKTFVRTSTDDMIRSQTEDGIGNAIREGQWLRLNKEGVLPRVVQTLAGRTASDKARIADDAYSGIVDAIVGPRGADVANNITNMMAAGQRIPQRANNLRSLTEYYGGRSGMAASESVNRLVQPQPNR